MNVAIIMPAYNEEKRISKTLEDYSAYFEGKLDYEILVVINNTKDRTEEVVKQYASKNKRIRYLNLVKGGKGYAIVEGWKYALSKGFDLLGFVDADMATSPQAFHELIKNIDGYDGAIANRYIKGSIIHPKYTLKRILASKIFNFLVRSYFLFPYTDTQCGAKLFTRKALEKVIPQIGMTKWAFDVELLYLVHRYGYKIKEVSTVWSNMQGSRINLKKDSVRMLFAISQLRIIKSPFRRLLRPVKPLIGALWRLVR